MNAAQGLLKHPRGLLDAIEVLLDVIAGMLRALQGRLDAVEGVLSAPGSQLRSSKGLLRVPEGILVFIPGVESQKREFSYLFGPRVIPTRSSSWPLALTRNVILVAIVVAVDTTLRALASVMDLVVALEVGPDVIVEQRPLARLGAH